MAHFSTKKLFFNFNHFKPLYAILGSEETCLKALNRNVKTCNSWAQGITFIHMRGIHRSSRAPQKFTRLASLCI